MKKIEKARKKLTAARLDMDSGKSRYNNYVYIPVAILSMALQAMTKLKHTYILKTHTVFTC